MVQAHSAGMFERMDELSAICIATYNNYYFCNFNDSSYNKYM